MTDAAQQLTQAAPPLDPAAVAAAGGANQSPLDVLDQILKDAQSKAKDAVESKVAEDEKKAVEERERQKKLDQQRIAEEMKKLEEVKTTPQYQAMVEQRQEVEEKKVEKQHELDGMEIIQLKHDKM
jgi:hypothetical protein